MPSLKTLADNDKDEDQTHGVCSTKNKPTECPVSRHSTLCFPLRKEVLEAPPTKEVLEAILTSVFFVEQTKLPNPHHQKNKIPHAVNFVSQTFRIVLLRSLVHRAFSLRSQWDILFPKI